MPIPVIILLIVLGVFILVPGLICTTIIPPFVFNGISRRKSPEKWSRERPSGNHPGILKMWDESLRFREKYKEQEEEMEARTQDGLRLKALYYDFGSDTVALIIPGRPESCIYSLYYAYPYADMGVNVLAIDTRAHGLSEGEYSGCGYAEQWDILAFVGELKKKGIKKVILHGICVGSCASVFAATNPSCPDIVRGVVLDGAFIHYYETLKKRIRKNKGPVYPTVWIFRQMIKNLYGTDCKKEGPISELPKLKIPCLMMASKEDIFSVPKNTQLLYEVNGSPKKKLEWFEYGEHSHLRDTDTVHYDSCVQEFVKSLEN